MARENGPRRGVLFAVALSFSERRKGGDRRRFCRAHLPRPRLLWLFLVPCCKKPHKIWWYCCFSTGRSI